MALKTAVNKKKGRELASDIASGWEQKRLLNKRGLQEVEVSMLRKLQDIYIREINTELPPHLEFIKKHYEAMGIKAMAYFKAKIKVQDSDFDKKKWITMMKDSDGFFKYEAEQIVKIVCQFQTIKKSRLLGAGYNTDPENLFCEELKFWATTALCLLDCSLKTKELLEKRCRYLEEVLCEDGLFDRPSSLITHTIQQVIVACRGVLRYRTIPIIDKELAHHDARRAFDSVKKHLVMLMADALDFCSNVFRTTKSKQADENDTVGQIISSIMSSENVASAFPNDQAEIRERLYAPCQTGEYLSPPRSVLLLGPNSEIFLSQTFITKLSKFDCADQNNLVKLTDLHLANLFNGSESGIEEKFRKNPQVIRQFIKLLALVSEVGDFYHVIEKAAACASQGGTLLVYGLANAQLNIMLETCDHLMGSLRESCSTLARVAELRFEELVFKNYATVKRNPWIIFFRTIHSTLSRIDKNLAVICQETALIKVKANSLTLYEMFQKATQDTTEFLSAASDFASHMSSVLGFCYNPPQQQQVLNLPDLDQLKSLCEGTDKFTLPNKSTNSEPAIPVPTTELLYPVVTSVTEPELSFLEVVDKKKNRQSIFGKLPRVTIADIKSTKKKKSEIDPHEKSLRRKTIDFSSGIDSISSTSLRRNSVSEINRNSVSGTSLKNSVSNNFARIDNPNSTEEVKQVSFELDYGIQMSKINDVVEPKTVAVASVPKTTDKNELVLVNQKLDLTLITTEYTKLELSRNKLQGSDIGELCRHLEFNSLKVLLSLNLSENNIGDDGAKALGYYLIEPDCNLQILNVSSNNITDKGGVQLVESLAENLSLKTLKMDFNLLTDITLIEIEKSLSSNPKCPLKLLCLAENEGRKVFSKVGAKPLWKLMSQRPALIITGSPFTITSIAFPTKKKNNKRSDNDNYFGDIANESQQRMRQYSEIQSDENCL